MKRSVSILLMILITFAFSGSPAWAADTVSDVRPLLGKDDLERVIKLVKARVDIPAEYGSFTSDVYDRDGKTLFRLQWSAAVPYATSGGGIGVTVDEYGNIISYSNYRYNTDTDYKRKLPTLTRSQAFDLARKFISNMCPDLIGQVAFDMKSGTIQFDGSYSFDFNRQYKNIPYTENNVTIQVNGQTGEIIYFNRNWNDDLKFPEPNGVMTPVAAKAAYLKHIPFELKYRMVKAGDGLATQLEYSPSIDDITSGIDAFTGEKIVINSVYNPYYGIASRQETLQAEAAQRAATPLPETEVNELKRLEGFISVESAEKLARGVTEFGIDPTCRLNGYSYLKSQSGRYTLKLEFVKALTKENLGEDIPDEKLKAMMESAADGGRVNITFDAKTSELLEFNGSMSREGKTPLDRGEMEKIAEAFLKKYQADKYPYLKLSALSQQANEYMMKYYGMIDRNNPGSFTYVRQINQIPFEDNRILLNIDPSSGKFTYYSETWNAMTFPAADNIITSDKAAELLFAHNPLTLKYVTLLQQDEKNDEKPVPGDIKLVYALDTAKSLCLDAKKGVLLNYSNGDVYQQPGIPQYNDISSHPAKSEIEALAAIGVLAEEKSFRPQEAILQKEFLLMIAKMRGYTPSGGSEQQALDSMYRMLANDGIIHADEQAPDEVVTRENAVKYLLKSAGYKKFAEMQGLFTCDYSDKDSIDPVLIGYASIAKALKLVDGTSFDPKKQLSRAEAVMMIYKYLKS